MFLGSCRYMYNVTAAVENANNDFLPFMYDIAIMDNYRKYSLYSISFTMFLKFNF